MTDSACTRAGYDSTGRYHVPTWEPLAPGSYRVGSETISSSIASEPDMCPECRAAPDQDCHTDCPGADPASYPRGGEILPTIDIEDLVAIPLAVQEHIFDMSVFEAVLECERLLLDAGPVIDLARERLRSGYEQYGCEMFTWDAQTRRRNVLEELADALVYLVSGPIE